MYCGDSHAALSLLMGGVCPKSPNRRHRLYKGVRRGREGGNGKGRYHGKNYHYYCKYCGHPHVRIVELAGRCCAKSPTGYHQPYEGEDKAHYVCSSNSQFRLIAGLNHQLTGPVCGKKRVPPRWAPPVFSRRHPYHSQTGAMRLIQSAFLRVTGGRKSPN
jgi:hypothetical protein